MRNSEIDRIGAVLDRCVEHFLVAYGKHQFKSSCGIVHLAKFK